MADFSHKDVLTALMGGTDLTVEQARWAFDRIMGGEWTDAQIAGFLVALAVKGETVAELVGAAEAMRARVAPVATGGLDVVDTCGTGGTGISTFNISTTAAFVAAGAGVSMAKHGNRTSTRSSGSANLLAALGINLDADADTLARCLSEAGMCFCFAVKHHPAMKYAVPVRKQLAVRTTFNLLGPLTNPAGAKRQVMGVPSKDLTATIAGVLRELGAVRALVVHSEDGLDEISTTAPAHIAELHAGSIILHTIDTQELGLPRASLDDLLVETAEQSAQVARAVLAGEQGAARDIVAINAAAAILVADKAPNLKAALATAFDSIDSGAAASVLESMIAISQGQ